MSVETLPSALPAVRSLHAVDPRLLLDERALTIASEIGYPIVAARKRGRDAMGLLAGGAVALMLGALTFWSMSAHRQPVPGLSGPAPRLLSPAVGAAPMRQSSAPAIAPEPAPRSLLLPSVPSVTAATTAVERAPAPVVLYDNSLAPSASAAPAAGRAPEAAGKAPPPPGTSDTDQFARRVGDAANEVATAQRLSSPATTVTQGTLIPAVLETAINTDLPGYARAVVSRDVKSFDGTRVLIPRSSRLIGQYKSGLSAGQRRAYVIWTRLIRPDGASVALASPAVDFAGSAGLAGKVSSHFMQRFGSAALLTVIGGLSAVASPTVVLSGGQSAASVAAQGGAQIPPTIRVAQGQPIRVFTARDLDFAAVADGGAEP